MEVTVNRKWSNNHAWLQCLSAAGVGGVSFSCRGGGRVFQLQGWGACLPVARVGACLPVAGVGDVSSSCKGGGRISIFVFS